MRARSDDLNPLLFLIGNKIDVTEGRKRRVVAEVDGRMFAKENSIEFLEVSAKDGTNMERIMESIGLFCEKYHIKDESERRIILSDERSDEGEMPRSCYGTPFAPFGGC
jgi:translation elongation factor EF-4